MKETVSFLYLSIYLPIHLSLPLSFAHTHTHTLINTQTHTDLIPFLISLMMKMLDELAQLCPMFFLLSRWRLRSSETTRWRMLLLLRLQRFHKLPPLLQRSTKNSFIRSFKNIFKTNAGCSGKIMFFHISLQNPSLACIAVRYLQSSHRNASVHSHSFWLIIFWTTNSNRVLARERWQTF